MVCKVLSCLCRDRYIPQRWLGAFLLMLVFVVCLGMRLCTSVAIGRMVKKSTGKTLKSNLSECPHRTETKNSQQYGENDWSEHVQGWIMNSFFIGYLLMHIPSGYLADKYGPRWVLISCVLVSIICTALIPISADKLGYTAVIALRIILGLGQGGLLIGITSWLTRWIPIHERAFIGSVSFSGSSVGPLLGFLLTDFLLRFTNDWRHIYYFWATTSIFVFFALLLYLYSDMDIHLHITKAEKNHLCKYLVKQQQKTWPYLEMITDNAVIGIIIVQAGHDVIYFLLCNSMPKYIKDVLEYSTIHGTLVESLPYLSMIVSNILTGALADWGIYTRCWDIGFIRKLYTVIGNTGSSILLVLVGYVGCNTRVAIVLYTMAVCIKGLSFSGMKINSLDLSTQYGGTIMALANGAGCFGGFFGPYIVSTIASENTLHQWQIVFWIMFVISNVTTALYVYLGSGQRRRWDYPEEDWQFFEGSAKKWHIFDGVDEDLLAVQRGRAYLRSLHSNEF